MRDETNDQANPSVERPSNWRQRLIDRIGNFEPRKFFSAPEMRMRMHRTGLLLADSWPYVGAFLYIAAVVVVSAAAIVVIVMHIAVLVALALLLGVLALLAYLRQEKIFIGAAVLVVFLLWTDSTLRHLFGVWFSGPSYVKFFDWLRDVGVVELWLLFVFAAVAGKIALDMLVHALKALHIIRNVGPAPMLPSLNIPQLVRARRKPAGAKKR